MTPNRWFYKLTHMGGQAVVPVEVTHISMLWAYLIMIYANRNIILQRRDYYES
jgi:hypothetical protein